ncbi:Spore coat protein [Chlamydia abortus]|uniref:Spore coat protein n=1 Tax=Paenibacillus residui TaxID=629724 RepID=A0ABW3DB75_9BACL|nr:MULTISPECIES: hypothetical protein [Paenibacillaceae]SHE11553.1 Spore coat protein [Chlamydia abortus]
MPTGNEQMTSDRNLISEKELLYLKDFMSWELLAMKKCNETANACTDPQLKQLIKQVGEKHKQHYQSILAHLQ